MRATLLLTGSTGMLGRELARLALARVDLNVILLVRQRRAVPDLLREAFGLTYAEDLRQRVRVVVGDVTLPGLGLAPRARTRLAAELTAVLHAAADTRFDRSLGDSRRVNVTGARNVLAFARECPRLDRIGILSTAFVAGRRTGTILEGERVHRAGFVNAYERAKYEAEAVVEQAVDMPWSIYRLSTLVGNRDTGYTSRFTTPHHALRIMHLGLASMVSGDQNCSVDLLPTDFAAKTVTSLLLDRFRPHRVFHVVAGSKRSYTLGEIIDRSYEHMKDLDPAWGRRPHPRPAIASQAAFDLLFEAAAQSRNVLMRQVLGTLRSFAGQFTFPKEFDVSTTHQAIPDYGQVVPDIRTYYEKVVRYCLSTDWGRHA